MRKTYGAEYPRTLGALLEWSGRDPTGPAVSDAAGTLNRSAFQDRVLRVAAGLGTAGAGPGARVALWLPNGSDYLAAIFACARLGALAIHINTRFRAAEVGSLLRRSRAVALVTAWGFPPVDFPAIFTALPVEDRAAVRSVLGLPLSLNVTQLAGVPVSPLDGAAAGAGPDEATGETRCLTFTTSGTTSGPKLVLHDQQTIAGHAVDVAHRIGLDAPDAALLGAVPFCGTFGNAAVMAAIAGGAHVVCLAQFDGEAAAELIRQHRVTHVIGGDDMFGRIAAASGRRRFDSVRFSGFAAFHSTAAASIAAAEAAGMKPHGLYGSSEVQALFSVSEGKNRLLGGGVPVSTQARLAVRNPENGSTLPVGASGELWIDAPSRFIEYLDNPAATERVIDADGMFRTSDLARLAGTGFIYAARIGDAMHLGGFLVNPEEIEAVIQAQPGVAGVQVVSASCGDVDPVPVAFVRPCDGAILHEAALRARCLEQLARFKVPERIVVVEAFPIVDSPNGPKVQRVRLRQMAEALLRQQMQNQSSDIG
ncbi:MAG: AMP-binding protein [Steroidobacteraceae bacterium]